MDRLVIGMINNPIDTLLPKESDPESMRLYRLRVAIVACSAWCTLFLVVIPAMTSGLPLIGRIAWETKVDEKIQKVMVDSSSYTVLDVQRGEDLKKQVEILSVIVRDDRADRIEQGVFNAKLQQCQAVQEKRSAIFWTEQLRLLLAQYRRIMNKDIEVPTCQELL